MKIRSLYLLAFILGLGTLSSCSNDDGGDATNTPENPSNVTINDVQQTYSEIALANYSAALEDTKSLKTTINTFVENPTQENFDNAKQAWLTSRESYGTTEAFRFANTPIDKDPDKKVEVLINSWPMDEAFVDYVQGDPDAGIINKTNEFPDLSKELLENQNGNGGEADISTGYHAIEFLLWGQDLTDPSANLPGQRAFTDYVTGASATAANADRRGEYLNLCADLLIDKLQYVVDQWAGPYKNTYMDLDRKTALNDMVSSLAELSGSELAIERMAVALETKDQEDEHSCFSDNTNRDIRLNIQGVANVYRGKYAAIDGASLSDLIAQDDPELAQTLNDLLDDAMTQVDASYDPFDIAISGGASSEKGAQVKTAVVALKTFANKLLDSKAALNIN